MLVHLCDQYQIQMEILGQFYLLHGLFEVLFGLSSVRACSVLYMIISTKIQMEILQLFHLLYGLCKAKIG